MRSRPQEALVTVGFLMAGAVATALLAWRSPLPADDAFHGTLTMLPLVLAALREIHRWGARSLSSAGTAGELGALAILWVLIFARPHLSLALADEVLAAGLLLVLACRVARQTLALRPLLGDRLPGRPSVLFFFLPLTVYLALLPWSAGHRQLDGDEPYYLLVTHSLAYDFDADLTNNYAQGDWRHFMARPITPQPGDPVGAHGELFSRHNEMLPLVLAPMYRLGGKMGALATMAALAAALAWMTLRLARHYSPEHPGAALAAYALAAFGPPLLLYSYQVWVEVPAALLAAAALDRILVLGARDALDGPQRSWSLKDWLGIGLPLVLLPLVKIRFVLIAAPIVPLAWWHAGRPKRPVLVLAGVLGVVGGGMLLYNQMVYANPLKIHTWQEVDPGAYGLASYLKGGFGLFYDAGFGLFGCAPVWLVLIPAAGLLIARRSRLLLHLVALSVPYLMVVAPRLEWYGGWSPPFRYALIAMPLLAVGLIPLLAEWRRPGALALLAALSALTLVLTLVWVTVPGWTYNFADGRTYLLDALSSRLGMDVARFFPSSVRPRMATWVWPVATIPLIPLLWWLPRRPGFRPAAALAGVALLLAAAALLPAVAARVPTGVVELEDPQVWRSGGHPHPDRWIVERTRYRGGWVLRVGETLKAPVVAGGHRVKIRLHAELIRNQPVPFNVDIKEGDRLLASWHPNRPRVWEVVEVGPVDWKAGEPLVLSAYGPYPPGEVNGAVLDRVEMEWR
ncbi:MAG TPA: hypothetical protein VGS07_25045 [Thermoanaerobaculia bacterium]|jgi:hypothetical protein|nr:hypothetical protein [Thermoanaerobaculia bacterium]